MPIILTASAYAVTTPEVKSWVDAVGNAILSRCGPRPSLKMYAYRHDLVDFLALDFDKTTAAPRGKVYGGFSITMSAHPDDKINLEVPSERVFEIQPSVNNWVDALNLAQMLCAKVEASLSFNPANC